MDELTVIKVMNDAMLNLKKSKNLDYSDNVTIKDYLSK